MKNAIIRDISTKMCADTLLWMNLSIDVNLSNLPGSFSYDDITEALSRGFNPIIFGKSLTTKKIIYNGPATIILWTDGTKTVVKCKESDPYSPEAGFALAVLKRLTGNDFHKHLRKVTKGDVKVKSGELL